MLFGLGVMTTSRETFPQRLTKVDDLMRADHSYLRESDHCCFIGEYTAGAGFSVSATNDLIINFKKGMDHQGRPGWGYKRRAILKAAEAMRTATARLGWDTLRRLTFVPIPPSKVKDDPLYDGRLTQMLNNMYPNQGLDIREIIVQRESTDPVHDSDTRPSPREIKSWYEINERYATPVPEHIVIVDDVLTTGAHFCAAKAFLSPRFPTAEITGLFIARRALDTSDV